MTSQEVLGLDLAKTALPDAIAVMVEAWYEAQAVEDETDFDLDETIGDCLEYIGNLVIHWVDGKQRKKINTVYELLEIRSKEFVGSRSNASFALFSAGIWYRGGSDEKIRISSAALPVFDYDYEIKEKWTAAILSIKGVKVYDGFMDPSVEISISFFLA
jgi:hypothetical protein